MRQQRSTTLFCFSPPVMLLTFVIELALALYTVVRYKMTELSRLAVAILLLLAFFQISEYMLCGGLGLRGVDWVRFGYISITLLPPVGLHMAMVLAKKNIVWLRTAAYVSAAVFIYFFVFVTQSLNGNDCRPNYQVFHLHRNLTDWYGLYYYGWLIVSTYLMLRWAQTSKRRRQLMALAAGYAVFIVPTTLVNILNPATTDGIPSIMCGFAVLLAIILAVGVLPGAGALRRR